MKIPAEKFKAISARLKAVRTSAGATYEAVSHNANLSIQTVKNAEDGKHDFTISTLIALAKNYGVSTDYILGLKPLDIVDNLDIQLSQMNDRERMLLLDLLKTYREHTKSNK